MILIPYDFESVLDIVALTDPSYGDFIADPTLEAGDVQVSKDGGAWANIGTLPSASPAASTAVQLTISATEAACKILRVRFIDQTTPKEWADIEYVLFTHGDDNAYIITELNSLGNNIFTIKGTQYNTLYAGEQTIINKVNTIDGIVDTILARIAAAVTFVSPIISSDTIEIVQGDDYKDADGRALSFALTDHGFNLTGATCKLTIHDLNGENADITSTGAIVEVDDDATLTFELTAAQTTTLSVSDNRHEYDVQIILSPGVSQRIVTPYRGTVTVLEQYSA
jgi:hypothetical protein